MWLHEAVFSVDVLEPLALVPVCAADESARRQLWSRRQPTSALEPHALVVAFLVKSKRARRSITVTRAVAFQHGLARRLDAEGADPLASCSAHPEAIAGGREALRKATSQQGELSYEGRWLGESHAFSVEAERLAVQLQLLPAAVADGVPQFGQEWVRFVAHTRRVRGGPEAAHKASLLHGCPGQPGRGRGHGVYDRV